MRRKLFRTEGVRQSAAGFRVLAAVTLLAACGGTEGADEARTAGPDTALAEAAAGADDAALRLGIDVLLGDSIGLVRDRRVGLITNHTGLSWPGGDSAVSTIDRLANARGVELVALFSPEHGIRGRAEAGEKVASDVDPATGLPVHSLYGETRKPTPGMLSDVDVLVFDIQDIGTRYYTYVWTMALAMEAAGEAGIPFVVLDRPNPLGGRVVQGNLLDPDYATFVGLYPVPMRHGLTVGELARFLVGEHGIDVDLAVAPMDGWSRDDWYDATGLPFVPPSPNMPSLASATHYPGTCLFEGTTVSVGRGTDRAFQLIGAPWLDATTIAARLNDRVAASSDADRGGVPAPDVLAGVRFEAVDFVPEAPGDRKFGGETVRGVRFVVTDRERYDPARAAVAALVEIERAHPDRLEWHVSHFDRLAGTDGLRNGIVAGEELGELTDGWPADVERFEALRRPYLLYE